MDLSYSESKRIGLCYHKYIAEFDGYKRNRIWSNAILTPFAICSSSTPAVSTTLPFMPKQRKKKEIFF
jgi:hypothetical protein